MANDTLQTSCVQDIQEDDECRENIPAGFTAAAGTSKLKVQEADVVGYSSEQPSGINEPLSDTCTFSNPGPTSGNGGVNAMSGLSGLQSALTPIVKYLNIGNRLASPEPLKRGNNPHLTAPPFSPGNTAANNQKSTGSSSQQPDIFSRYFGRSLDDSNNSAFWVINECLPEISFLDSTCDSPMQMTKNDSVFPDSVLSTPVTGRSVKSSFTVPLFPLDGNVTHTLSSISEQSDKFVDENPPKASLKATQDISMDSVSEDGQPSSEPSGPNMVKIQTAEVTFGTHPANVTHDISSSSHMSVQCAVAAVSASDMQCNISSKNGTFELHDEQVVNSDTTEANNQVPLKNNDNVPQPSPKTAGSKNAMVIIAEQSNLSASTSVNTCAQELKTLDLLPSNVNGPKGECEAKDHSQSGLPVEDGLSDTLGHQSMAVEQDNKANTFNLDDTLELRADSLTTSTPLTNCKMLNFHIERDEGKIIGVQKKLCGDGPSKPNGRVPSDAPSNIICDRKTFLLQPAAKSPRPPLKAASQLLKHKPASLLPGRLEPMSSGLPITRQRTQAEALRNTAASEAPHMPTGASVPYRLHSTATRSKQSNPGLQKPRYIGIPSGIQRAAPGLRPLSARSNTQASMSTDKIHRPTATNSATKISQAKKHPLTRGEALPTAKRKRTDAPLPSGTAEASTSSCDAAKRAKHLKPTTTSQRALPSETQKNALNRRLSAVPARTAQTSASCNAVSRTRTRKQPLTSHKCLLSKPQCHACAKWVAFEKQLELKSKEIKRLKQGCAALEQQLELKSEEIKGLKEELLNNTKPQDEY